MSTSHSSQGPRQQGSFVAARTLALSAVLLTLPAGAGAAPGELPARQVLARGAESYGPVTPISTVKLRDLAQARAWQPGDPIREVPRRTYMAPGKESMPFGEGLPDPLVELWRQIAAPTITLDVNIAGTAFTGATPPDTVGDVGPSHYVQAVNSTQIAIFDKTGVMEPGFPIALESLAPSGPCQSGSGDPIILYDWMADRWFLQEFTGGGVLCIYISQTADPTGAYHFYSFTPPDFPDYPHYGVWSDAYYAGTNEAGGGGNQTTYAFNRVAMLAGSPATMQRLTAVPPLTGYGFQVLTPADHDGDLAPPSGAPGIFMRHRDDEAHGGPTPATDQLQIFEMDVDWVTPANTTVTILPDISITDYNSWFTNYTTFFSVPQPGSGTRLDPIREAILNRLVYRNFGTHETLVGNFATNRNPATAGSVVEAGIRWFELRRTGGIGNPWVLHQEGTFGGNTNSATANFFMGAISMDGAGNIALGYNKTDTASSVFPSLGVTGRLAADTLGTMGPETAIVAGTQPQGGTGRWGDYAAMAIDPADDCTFWLTGEYMPTTSWGTRVTSFVFEECLTGFRLTPSPTSIDVCAATDPDPQFNIDVTSVNGWSDDVTLTADGLPPSTTAGFTNNGSLPNFTSVLTVSNTDNSTPGTYEVTITGTGGDVPATLRSAGVTINLSMVAPGSPSLVGPANYELDVPLVPTLSWNAGSAATSYTVEVASDSNFTQIVESAVVTGTSYTLGSALDPITTYHWRVTAANTCGDVASTASRFQTVGIGCTTFPSTNVPLAIPPTGTQGTTNSTLVVAAGGVLADVNVKNLVGTHTYLGDINFNLTSPAATSVQIMASSCGSADNFNLNLDDQAAPGAWPCPPTTGGTYQPSNSLSAFAGENRNGTWTLTINDTEANDVGILQSWGLELCVEVSNGLFGDGFESGSTSGWTSDFP